MAAQEMQAGKTQAAVADRRRSKGLLEPAGLGPGDIADGSLVETVARCPPDQ